MIIGICGKSGSGKSTIAHLITENKQNVMHCNIDKIGHQVMQMKEVEKEAIKCFGNQILTNGKLDRKKLAETVFNSRNEMDKLSELTWKHMKIIIDNLIKDESKIIILDWILLSKTHYFAQCDLKILIDTPYDIRKQRALTRDNITPLEFDLREKASIEYNECDFDIVLKNSNIKEIRKLVKQI